MLKINEIFFSAQGEGNRVGKPSVFVRLAGCSAGCDYCDTKDAWTKGKFYSEEEIISVINSFEDRYKNFQIVITGGEPFEQDIRLLVARLKKDNRYIAIETNGFKFYNIDIDWFAVSPKDVYDYRMDENLINKIDEMKLIVNKNLNLDIVRNLSSLGNFPIYLQPNFFEREKYKITYDFYNKCVEIGIKNIRLGFQLHRLYGID